MGIDDPVFELPQDRSLTELSSTLVRHRRGDGEHWNTRSFTSREGRGAGEEVTEACAQSRGHGRTIDSSYCIATEVKGLEGPVMSQTTAEVEQVDSCLVRVGTSGVMPLRTGTLETSVIHRRGTVHRTSVVQS